MMKEEARNMAAPLAHFDEDWQDLYELRMSPARGCERKAEPWNSDLNVTSSSPHQQQPPPPQHLPPTSSSFSPAAAVAAVAVGAANASEVFGDVVTARMLTSTSSSYNISSATTATTNNIGSSNSGHVVTSNTIINGTINISTTAANATNNIAKITTTATTNNIAKITTTATTNTTSAAKALAASSTDNLEDLADLESFSGEIVSFKSMEDLVNDFDEKLTVCFRNFDTDTGYIAPVVPLAEQGLLKDDEIWNAVTDNFGNVMPVDWSSSHARTLQIPTLNMKERFEPEGITLDLSDDEELREQLDMHSIIVSCINDEPIFTAEQVIEEIEEMMMMQESPDGEEEEETPTQSDRLSLLSQEINALKRSSTNNSCQDPVPPGLKRMSMAGLTELLEEMESAARSFSEELVTQLARRDELDFEKEVNNSFISALIDVQNKQKEHRESLRRKKRRSIAGDSRAERAGARMPSARFSMENLSNVIQNGIRQTFGNGGCEKQYLTTVIPYEKKMGAPSVEDLQILTKILNAMKDDSEKVPTLLTDYILKVLCPT
uniref:Fasciculation and elongation protein zeta-2-like isoform X1 n=1 Tax=Petromyzon marinus TaxID=7757 RepID=A0AAJ7TL26_PETMA|nr:fasciculation and elongation protein zeta-2-like isoform X1 [Petromyzon marinus]